MSRAPSHVGKARFEVEWTSEAWAEVQSLPVFERRPIMRAVDDLRHEAEVETQNRKPLRKPLEELPEATWEIRIRGKYRLLYCVTDPIPENNKRCVQILRAIIKEREPTSEALRRQS